MEGSSRKTAVVAGAATVSLALFISADAWTGDYAPDRKLAPYLGGIALVAVVGAAVTRLRGPAIRWVLALAAAAQGALLVAMLWTGFGAAGPVVVINGLLAVGYAASSHLFGKAEPPPEARSSGDATR